MNIQIIDEHSIDLDLLPVHPTGALKQAFILDAGCRGFGFTKYFLDRGDKVLPVDIDQFETDYTYLRMGLYFHSGKAGISDHEDPQARKITDITLFDTTKKIPPLKEGEVYLGTIEGCAFHLGIEKFDIVKMDIEGAEISILQNAKHPIAQQVSVEFHGHCGQSKESLDHLLKYLENWYHVYGAVWESRHGCSENYWDILLVAK